MICPACGADLGDPWDAAHANYDGPRARRGQHTGDIYRCPGCDELWIDNLLATGEGLGPWSYDLPVF